MVRIGLQRGAHPSLRKEKPEDRCSPILRNSPPISDRRLKIDERLTRDVRARTPRPESFYRSPGILGFQQCPLKAAKGRSGSMGDDFAG
jgi:hypothetical protein